MLGSLFNHWSMMLSVGSALLGSASGHPQRSSGRKSAAKAAKHKKYLKRGKKK